MAKSIFVFGSNLAGRHGLGAAKEAFYKHGAIIGQGEGWQGQSYALPTKDVYLESLPLEDIEANVHEFLRFAKGHPDLEFEVTRVGCGLAGYKDEQIAPMFFGAPTNCAFSSRWSKWLPGYAYWTDQ